MTPAEIAKLIAVLPQLLALYTSFETALAATKGESPVARDFDVVAALLPQLKQLAISIEAATTAAPAAAAPVPGAPAPGPGVA